MIPVRKKSLCSTSWREDVNIEWYLAEIYNADETQDETTQLKDVNCAPRYKKKRNEKVKSMQNAKMSFSMPTKSEKWG